MKIGNNILFNSTPCKIVNVINKLVLVSDNKTKVTYCTTFSRCEGVLITKNVLHSFGFIKRFRSYEKGKIKIYNKPLNTMQLYYFEGKRIKYVHELENIINK